MRLICEDFNIIQAEVLDSVSMNGKKVSPELFIVTTNSEVFLTKQELQNALAEIKYQEDD